MSEALKDWLLYLPIAKAVQAADGRLEIEGIASDESVDLENEIVKASGLESTLRILEERGVIDWDHGRHIGQIDKAALIPVEEAQERFPELNEWYGRDYRGRKVFYLHGWIDAPVEDEPENRDLLDARHALKAGHRLGFSVSGGRLKRGEARGEDGRIYPATEQAVLTKVALTACPINTNTVARVAKSLSAAMQTPPDPSEPVMVVTKGLTAGGGTDSAAFTGGRAMTPESLHGGLEDTLWGCRTCATRDTTKKKSDTPPRCRVCGGEMVRMDRREQRAVRKGLSPLQRIALDLTTEEDVTMVTMLEKAADKLAKSALGKLIGVLGKAAELDEEDVEDIAEEVEDVTDELGDLGEEAAEAEGDEEGFPPEEGDDDGLDGEPPLGVEDEDEQAPSKAEADEIIAALEDAEDIPDLGEGDTEDEEEDDMKRRGGMMKSVAEALGEAEGGDEVLAVLDAEGLLDGVLGSFAKSIEARLDAQDEALAALMETQAALGDLLGPQIEEVRKSVQEVEQAEVERRKALGARPAGTKLHKSPNEGEAAFDPDELGDRITKGLRDEGCALGMEDAGAMRVLLRKGRYEEVAAGLDRAGA